MKMRIKQTGNGRQENDNGRMVNLMQWIRFTKWCELLTLPK